MSILIILFSAYDKFCIDSFNVCNDKLISMIINSNMIKHLNQSWNNNSPTEHILQNVGKLGFSEYLNYKIIKSNFLIKLSTDQARNVIFMAIML